jgi:hypothetical protein
MLRSKTLARDPICAQRIEFAQGHRRLRHRYLGGALRDKSAPASFYEDFALAAFLTFSTDAADVNAAFG